MSPSSATRSIWKSTASSDNASSRNRDKPGGVRVVRVYEAGELDDKNKLSREKKRKLDNSQERLRPSEATEARVHQNPAITAFMASLGLNKESIGGPEESQQATGLPQDTFVQVTTYYNEKINQLSTERDSLRNQLNSCQEERDSSRQKLDATEKDYHFVNLMRLDAAQNLEKERKKREKVEKELEELKNKIRRLV